MSTELDWRKMWAEMTNAYGCLVAGVFEILAREGSAGGESIIRLLVDQLDDADALLDFDLEVIWQAWREVGGADDEYPIVMMVGDPACPDTPETRPTPDPEEGR